MGAFFEDFSEFFGVRSLFDPSEEVILKLSPQEAARGCERTIYVQHGSRRSGLLLSIPAGVEEGTVLRIVAEELQPREILLRIQIG